MLKDEIDLIRDVALSIEDLDIDAAYKLMRLAQKYRPQGNYIGEKVNEYQNKLQIDNGSVNLHFGLHKTATTYIQENLEQIDNPAFHYTKLDEFRLLLKKQGYYKYLKSLDFNKRILISDENLIGGNGTALSGSLYPDLSSRINKILYPYKNRELLTIYISIRPITSFLPSQYCEYLRWNKYISYDDFTRKINVSKVLWTDVLKETLIFNNDLQFNIFNFEKFNEGKNELLEKLSFGIKNKCDQTIKPSRESFTYKELSNLSNGTLSYESNSKFDPHTKEEKEASMLNYRSDIFELAKYSNVTLIPQF